jgi:hypothetical protein
MRIWWRREVVDGRAEQVCQTVDLFAARRVQDLGDRPPHPVGGKDTLPDQEMLLDRDETIQAGLQRNQQRQRAGDPVRPGEVTVLEGAPQGGQRPHHVTGRHGADRPATEAVDQEQSPGALEDPGPASGGAEQPGQPRADRRSLRLEHHPVAEFAVQPGLQPDGQWPADVAARVLDDQRDVHPGGDRGEVAQQFVVARRVQQWRGGHHGVRARVRGVPRMTQGGGERFRARADDTAATAAGQPARHRSYLVAFLRRHPQYLGHHGEDDAVRAVAEHPVEQLLQGWVVDPVMIVERGLEDREHPGQVRVAPRSSPLPGHDG